MTYPRVLIFGQPFNNFSGGGITLSNLFRGWPKDKICVTFIGHGLINITYDVCDTYYQLGREEHRWIFPFNLINRSFTSGIKPKLASAETTVNAIQLGVRYLVVNRFFYPFLKWIGLFHCASRISLSEKMKTWLREYKPELLYLQVSTRETLLFAAELIDYLKVPSVLHVMDDWPSMISSSGLLKNFWHKKIDFEFRKLLMLVDLHLSISDAMTEEYFRRYSIRFVPFHNPIETEWWLQKTKKNYSLNQKRVKVLYSGRIGIGITNSLVDVASAIDSFPIKDFTIELHIQTPSKESFIIRSLKKFKCIVFDEFADYSELPEIFSGADILLLANEFNKEGIKYLKYSMPTKASEYMISGTPVLVYAPGDSAVSRLFEENRCGVCVKTQKPENIVSAIDLLITNEDLRREIGRNAVDFAKRRFDMGIIRNEFQLKLVSNYSVK
ncbi:MAG: glycosyltransferase family 4 protein [Bacteroidales bacterium]|nr:glycosyltransferase family 4 protein [Bacteroidales bacterium]